MGTPTVTPSIPNVSTEITSIAVVDTGAGQGGGSGPASDRKGTMSGAIYRVQPDGYARRVWSHPQDVVYALALDPRGNVIAGTGNRGSIYRLDSERSYTRLVGVAPSQVTGLTADNQGRIYAVTGNIGEVFT